MPVSRSFRLTVYVSEECRQRFQQESYRLWSQLMALGASVLEEHTKAGTIIAESDSSDAAAFERIPDVVAVRIVDAPEPVFEPPVREAKQSGNVTPLRPDPRKDGERHKRAG